MRRASEVMEGAYIGLFEWLCWSHLHAKKVLMMFGSNVFDLSACAPLIFPPGRKCQSCYVIGCLVAEEGLLSALQPGKPDFPTMNHYVIGAPQQQASAPIDLTADPKRGDSKKPPPLGASASWKSMSEAASLGGPSLIDKLDN